MQIKRRHGTATFPGSLTICTASALPSLSESGQEETLGVKALGPHLGKIWSELRINEPLTIRIY